MKQFDIILVNQFTDKKSVHTLGIWSKGNKIKDMFAMNKVAQTFTNECIDKDNTLYRWHFAN